MPQPQISSSRPAGQTANGAASAWAGKRVTVMGLGRHGGGVGAARYLARQGAHVTISDRDPAWALAASIAQLREAGTIA